MHFRHFGRALAVVMMTLIGWQASGRELPAQEVDIGTLIGKAQGGYVPITDAAVGQAKRELQARVAELNARLRGYPSLRTAWRKYLMSDELEREIGKPRADNGVLQAVLAQFSSGEPGVEWQPIVNVRSALRRYSHLAMLQGDEKAAERYQAAWDELAKRWEAYQTSAQIDDAVSIGRAVGWLERSQQSPALVSAIQQRFSTPNLQVRVSRKLASAGVDDDVNDSMPISENIMGTQMEGTAWTRGRISLDFVPDDSRASLDIRLSAKTNSENVGYHGPVTIYSRGWTDVLATKRVHVDANGLNSNRAQACCETSTVIDDICARLQLMEKIAWKQAAKKKPQAEAIGNSRAEVRVASRVDEQAAEMLDKAQDSFENKFRAPLRRRDAFPRKLAMSTTSDRLAVTVWQHGANQLAAPHAPPTISAGSDLQVQLHESFAGNMSESAIGGQTLTDEKVESLIKDSGGEVPEELKIGPDKDPWSITFSSDQPVSTQFSKDSVAISIRGRRFTRGDQEVKELIKISASYSIEKTPSGSKLTRQGDVDVDFVNYKGGLPVKLVAFKTFMRRKFEALLKPEFVSEGLKLPGRWEKSGKLFVQQMQAQDGWLALGWDLNPAAAATAAVDEGESGRVASK